MCRTVPVSAAAAALLLAALSGCGGPAGASPSASPVSPVSPVPSPVQTVPPSPSAGPDEESQSALSGEEALAIALSNAGVPEADAYNVKVEQDRDGGIPIYDIEFETEYGDYDYEIAVDGGRIVGADYEVDEEWLDALGGEPVTLEEAQSAVAEKVSGASPSDVQIWEEGGDGRSRYEGTLSLDGMYYEFELDPQTGIIFDWNADLRG